MRFVSPRPHHILSSYYRAADVVIVPSRSESFGLVALEAAACGVPVVASAVGGLLNIVHDGVTGVLVDGRDPARFARAITQLLDDPGRRGGDGGRRGRAGQALHVELHRGPAAPPLRRPRRPAGAPARRLLVSSSRRRVAPVTDVHDDAALAVLERRIDEWLASIGGRRCRSRPSTAAEGDVRRWYVRLRGEDKDFTTVWLTLGQRTLRYETYVMPAPEENAGRLYEHLLRRNERLVGAHFSIGVEDAVFLRGELPLDALERGRARPGDRHAVRHRRAALPGAAAHRLRSAASVPDVAVPFPFADLGDTHEGCPGRCISGMSASPAPARAAEQRARGVTVGRWASSW